MAGKIEKFIRDTHKQYNIKYALTGERIRKIRYKLAAADIVDSVHPNDEKLAQNIILADYNKASSTMRTASATGHTTHGFSQKNAGMCPRCGQGMVFANLASQSEARYCHSCHVCVPVN